MALKRITDLTAAATLDGTELAVISQGGTSVKTTVAAIVATATGTVTSFNTRTGAVVPVSGDYTFTQIGSTPTTLAGYGITDAATSAEGAKANSAIQSVVAGSNITVDNTDPHNPVVSSTASGGAGTAGLTPNEQTSTTYTLVATDADKFIRCTNAAAIALTIPTNATVALPIGLSIPVFQGGAGVVTISGASGVTLESPNGAATTAQGDFRTLFQRATDVWVIG